MIDIKENELYQEIELFLDGEKIGEAEVDLKGKMLSRLSIFPPYQNKGYGTEVVKLLNEKYNCECLWVNADNDRAINVYKKNGYEIVESTMYLMKRSVKKMSKGLDQCDKCDYFISVEEAYQQGREDMFKEIQEMYTEWQIETKGFYITDTETTRFLNKLGKKLKLLKGAEYE